MTSATAREVLLLSLSPDLVDAIEELVAERVRMTLEDADGGSPWLSMAEAAEYVRVSERTLNRHIEKGKLRATKIGRRTLLNRDDLDALAAGEGVAPTTPPGRRKGV